MMLRANDLQDKVQVDLAKCNCPVLASKAHYRHGPHLEHGPLGGAVLLADVGLSMPVALYLQVEDCIHSLIICCFCFLSPPCTNE